MKNLIIYATILVASLISSFECKSQSSSKLTNLDNLIAKVNADSTDWK